METVDVQAKVFENIKSLCENYKKDGASRKTINYLTKRLTSLEEQWADFDDRHIIIEQIGDKNIDYYTKNAYETTKKMYLSTRKDILSLMMQMQSSSNEEKPEINFVDENRDENEAKKKISELSFRQECNLRAVNQTIYKINLHKVNTKWELEENLNLLKNKWEAVDKLHWELIGLLKDSNPKYNQAYDETEFNYDRLKKELNTKIHSSIYYQQSAPKIDIPDFNGSYNQWISFKDLFIESIHNNPSIPTATKMQHLKSKLKGEAEKLVQHLYISTENYQTCWDILRQRYDNHRLLFSSLINTMLNLPTIQQANGHNTKKMHDVIDECLNGLKNIGVETSSCEPIIVHLMSQKLDTTTYNEYIKELKDPRELPTLDDFMNFLENKFIAYETMNSSKLKDFQPNFNKQAKQNFPNKNFQTNKNFSFNYKEQPKTYSYFTAYGNCPLCKGGHVLMQCPQFIDMDSSNRNRTVAKLAVCKNCLYVHKNNICTSTNKCKECSKPHHTLLHYKPANINNNQNETQQPGTTPSTSNHLSSDDTEVLLTTVKVRVQAIDGTYVILRALLDQGSQVNLVSENAAQILRLPRKKMNATITGVGSASKDCKGLIELKCASIHSEYNFQVDALIMKRLINNLPNTSFETNNWKHIENLKLADPDFNVSGNIDILFGADVYSEVIMAGVLKGSLQSPTAQQTHLGWVLCGKLKTYNCNVTLLNVEEITKFWETEDITPSTSEITETNQCEQFYKETTKRTPDGKYIVQIPYQTDYLEKLGQTKLVAMSQYLQLEKRMARNEKFQTMYKDFINEYKYLQHMIPVLPGSSATSGCLLPHHGVLREQSTTTKLRVVFNASQKTSSGYSLNDVMEKGPNLQKDIQALILKWRSYKYVYTADVEKMYRCIWTSIEQQPALKILWRNSIHEQLKEWQLCTVTYGTKSAPWLAMRTLQQIAIDDGHKYPEAAKILQNEFYVDDLISGSNDLRKAKELQISLIKLMQGAGMNLRKWSSNEPTLLSHLAEDQISKQHIFDFKTEEAMKTLGLGWNPTNDTFSFNWNLEEISNKKLTKRIILSEISKIYDPMGWLSPVTLTAKLIFQKVWLSTKEWDEETPPEIQKEWTKLKSELHYIKNYNINRWIGSIQTNIELHGFCDASEKAYACAIYSRAMDDAGAPVITLLVAKTRVVPLQQKTTLPRLELCGALLLSKLMEKVTNALTDNKISIHAWCDSQVVLAWIQGSNSKWDKYVTNRVQKIKEIIPANKWSYVRSAENAADCASRGLFPSKLVNFNLWWQGPTFLTSYNEQKLPKENEHFSTTIGLDETQTCAATLSSNKDNFIIQLLNKCSTLTRVYRVTAWIIRYVTTLRNGSKPTIMHLTTADINEAADRVIKCSQQQYFTEEFIQLQQNKYTSSKSSIYKLNPYIDEQGIIRVGGRLTNSNLNNHMKNPVILPNKSRLTELVIESSHQSTLHGGARLTLAHLRQRYWIIGGNRAVKTQLRKCVRCHRHKPSNNYQLMADLPKQRVMPSRPFTNTGVDFTGHIQVKLNKGRGVKTTKGYIAVFICMATKAVHIELVSDLSTETFLAAFQRMCARRGTPKHVYSDCGTNFVGAANVLRNEFDLFKQLMTPDFFDEINKLEVEWHFNCPAWPSAGGLWEAAVKSLKHHLRRVLGDQKLTYEELTTLLSKIEACMNSRPLVPLTEDPDEFYDCLTPGHFLTGSATLSLPQADYNPTNINMRKRWQLIVHMTRQFWKSWSSDYLTQLQLRSKWQRPSRNLQVGDIVLVKEDNLPPGRWALGRVLETHPGRDGYTRVATVKTQTGSIKRPIVKLSPLPIDYEPTTTPDETN